MISPSVKIFFSARWREAIAGISADATGGQTTASNATAGQNDRNYPEKVPRPVECAHR